MRASPEFRQQLHLRHGKSKTNKALSEKGFFEGGAPGPVPLVETGIHQARGAGVALTPFNIDWIATSPLPRAQETSYYCNETYPGNPKGPIILMGLREVSHGILEQQSGVTIAQADAYRTINVKAMAKFMHSLGINEGLIEKFAGWLASTGLGDGESYLDAACRASSDVDHSFIGSLPNGLLVGHNGSLRGLRVLGTALTLEERIELRRYHSGVINAQQQSRAIIRELQTEQGRYLNTEEMAAVLNITFDSSSAEKLVTIVDFFEQCGVPAIGDVLGRNRRIPNGAIIDVFIGPDGKMARNKLIVPRLPKEGVLLTTNNVEVDYQDYNPASQWV